MEYNSQKEVLVIPEYGRNMQELIRHTLTIEDAEERQAHIEAVIDLMQQMHPQSRNVADSKLKLWQHAIRIAEQDLKVEYPEGLSPEIQDKKPDRVAYPVEIRRYRHYGKNVPTMIAKACEMEEGPIRDGFVRTIASYMKMSYQNWHRDANVSDKVIKADLESISGGLLTMDEEDSIDLGYVKDNFDSPRRKVKISNRNQRQKKKHSSNRSNKSSRSNRSNRRRR